MNTATIAWPTIAASDTVIDGTTVSIHTIGWSGMVQGNYFEIEYTVRGRASTETPSPDVEAEAKPCAARIIATGTARVPAGADWSEVKRAVMDDLRVSGHHLRVDCWTKTATKRIIIGRCVRDNRETMGLSIAEAADVLLCSKRTLGQWERSDISPRPENITTMLEKGFL